MGAVREAAQTFTQEREEWQSSPESPEIESAQPQVSSNAFEGDIGPLEVSVF